MKMWSDSTNPSIEPPEPKHMPGRPKRCRRKAKDEPRKKYGKLSKKGVKMTCSNCQQTGHNKFGCMKGHVPRSATQQSQNMPPPPPKSSQEIPSQQSNPSSICEDTSVVKRQSNNQSIGIGRGRGRGRGHRLCRGKGRGTTLGGGSANEATIGHKRPMHTDFGIFTDTMTGTTILNPGISAGTFKDISATNIDIGFKLPILKYKGRNAMTRSQLQQMSAARKKGSSSQTSSAASTL
uniref:Uncharacterized protein n=1 Tax=Nicotiana tabacum TaxID=4097 RepID=A0A1S3YFZ1_TOBAC|nr:PREDICTED: uncharacterized protein LOC107775851 [Nicotiana tabacum]